ncbi:hypothetical protein DITRI_Ditri09bG0113100 [Diplodiscus trichospermus]
MASSSSSGYAIISQEQIKYYYIFERNIFSRLVWSLERNPSESMHVMALFIWLQNSCSHAANLVYNMQLWPDNLINALADEAVQCLNVMKGDEFPYINFPGHIYFIPLIRNLSKNEFSILFFHHNRLQINPWISNLVQNFCTTAFDDIITLRLALSNPQSVAVRSTEQNLEPFRFDHGPSCTRLMLPSYNNIGNQNMVGTQQIFCPKSNAENSGFSHGKSIETKTLDKDMDELLNNLHSICMEMIKENTNNNKDVDPDDRSIFLTFSVGFPISKNEVIDFFTRNFGDNFVEVVEMQTVQEGKQPIYGRMVLKSASDIETVLNGKPIAKFSIKGKDVWCRKYEPARKRPSPLQNLQIPFLP